MKRRRLGWVRAVVSTLGSYWGGIGLRHVYGDRLYGEVDHKDVAWWETTAGPSRSGPAGHAGTRWLRTTAASCAVRANASTLRRRSGRRCPRSSGTVLG